MPVGRDKMAETLNKRPATQVWIDHEQARRRIDNYLISQYKNLPKSRVYQMIRKGEVRVNGRRIKQTYRLQAGDKVRLPPAYLASDKPPRPSEKQRALMRDRVLYADDALLIFNKPAGLAVHGGTRQRHGVIEILRALNPGAGKIELVHRLDKHTSGCLIIATDMVALRDLHASLRDGRIDKTYQALLCGRLQDDDYEIDVPLDNHRLRAGERIVEAKAGGRHALSYFSVQRRYTDATLVKIKTVTGRTHQIRVHADYIGHPIAGDPKYGNKACNKQFNALGLKRMFLHAASLQLRSPDTGEQITVQAPLPEHLAALLSTLE